VLPLHFQLPPTTNRPVPAMVATHREEPAREPGRRAVAA